MDTFDIDEPEFPWDERDAEVAGKYFSLTEADIAAARLRSEGIPCFVANATTQVVLPHIPGFVRLHVRPQDVERAREILAEAIIDAEQNAPTQGHGNGLIWALLAAIALILLVLLGKAMGW